jgi:general secretion pathway protein A
MTDMEVLLPLLPIEISPALKELDRMWMLQPGAASPCTQSIQQQQKVQCYRSSLWRLPVLTKLDRPGVLVVKNKNGQGAYAVLTHINDHAVTLLVAGREYHVTLLNLARFWQGEFATYWRPPSHFPLDLRRVDVAEASGQLSKQLDALEGMQEPNDQSAPNRVDPTLITRVKAFQASQGLDSDGYPGPMTFMMIEKLLGVNQLNLKTGDH